MDKLRKHLTRSLHRASPGMTLLEIMIVLAILALVMGLLVGPRVMASLVGSQSKTTEIKLRKYAFEAYPAWLAAHPDAGCPEKLADLNEYMNNHDSNDAWGQPMKMLCGSSLPPDAKGIGVVSAGPDKQEGTADDLKSWQ